MTGAPCVPLANGPRRAARPHALIVPRRHRDGWSSATAPELAARQTAMRLVAAWYASIDGGGVVFGANVSAPNLDYRRDVQAAAGTLPAGGTGAAVTKNPRQHAHLHAFYAEPDATENHESSAGAGHPVIAAGQRAFRAALLSDAVPVDPDSTRLAVGVRAAAQPWGGSYCSYQRGVDGPLVGHAGTGTLHGRVQPAPGPGRWPHRRTRPGPGRGHQPGPAHPGRRGPAPRGPPPTSGRVSRPSPPGTD